jgi:hypothetical protein
MPFISKQMAIKIGDNYDWEFHLRFTLLNNVRRHNEAEIPTFERHKCNDILDV